VSNALNPKILGVRLSMLLFLYRRRVRAHPIQELLAGSGVAIGVALVFGVLLANASLTGSASELVHGLAGSATLQLSARSTQGFDAGLAEAAGNLPGVEVASPLLRENITLIGPRGEEAVQLIGATASLEALGGVATQNLGAANVLRSGGLGLPSGVMSSLGTHVGQPLRVSANGVVQTVRVRALLRGEGLSSIAASPVAVTVLPLAQRLTQEPGRVSEVLIRPQAGAQAQVRGELQRLAAARVDVRPADDELSLLSEATKPNRQSTSLFTVIAVMIGFLLALSAILLTVPERRRFIAELRMQGYDPRQVLLLLGLQALILGLVASFVGIGVGAVLSRVFFQRVPAFLSAAFPLGTQETVHAGSILLALGAGVLATALASLVPLFDLRPGRPADAVFREVAADSEVMSPRTIRSLALAGVALIVLVSVLALLVASLTVVAGVALAVAMLCLIPAVFSGVTRVLPWASERVRSSALFVALSELRATTTRAVALAGIVALAVYGGVAIGGARDDLLGGIGEATDQYFATAQLWVTSGRDVFNTNSFAASAPAAEIAHARGVASVRVYQGGLLDVGERRMWVRARPASDSSMFESSQLLHGGYATATRRIRAGGWAAISSGFAAERHLRVGDSVSLPTPTGLHRVGVAAILTNSGWPPGAITLSSGDYGRWFRTADGAALEVSLRPGVRARQERGIVSSALAGYPGLEVRTVAERTALSEASAHQGLRTLSEISTLLLIAAALAVAAALSATIWQRRARLAALRVQGYDRGQLWRAVLLESTITIAVGAIVGAIMGVFGHALASRFLERSTGFPAPFALDAPQVLLTLALLSAIALVVIAIPGGAAARVSPTTVFQD
jgi:putative ABC transport system permease protein